MSTLKIMRTSKIWINVTASEMWNRPPVGILRVEQALTEGLSRILGDRLGKCIWHDGKFVDQMAYRGYVENTRNLTPPSVAPKDVSKEKPSDFAANNFDVVQTLLNLLSRKLKKNVITLSHELTVGDSTLPPEAASVFLNQPKPCLQRGDVLISVGLDWDYPYTWQFHDFKVKHGIHVIACCYDLIPVLFPQYCAQDVAKWFSEYLIRLSWGASAVLCISKQTQSDYLELCNQLGLPEPRTEVITLGDNVPTDIGEVGKEISLLGAVPFILFVSSIERRKNHDVLYKAYHLLAKQGHADKLPKLVFVGMHGWGVADLMKDIELDPLTKGMITQLNHVNDAELNYLYKKATFCAYPSLYEGWGLPIGEALAMGKLVIASDKGSIPEVGGELVHYVDAWNPSEWANTILDYVLHPDKIKQRELEVSKKYTVRKWTDTSKAVADIAIELASKTTKQWSYSGYEMQTQCGQKSGGKIRSNSLAGFLCHGPYTPLKKGSYTVDFIFTRILKTDSIVMFQVASSQGNLIHASDTVNAMDFDRNSHACHFELMQDTFDVEFRVFCGNTCELELEKVSIVQNK
jgi:glycosyltransferase involved in cell wall biosynthesis